MVKGKIFTDSITVFDLADGEIKHGKTPIANAFKINNDTKSKWYIMYAKSAVEKEEWVNAFLLERETVAKSISDGSARLPSIDRMETKSRLPPLLSDAEGPSIARFFCSVWEPSPSARHPCPSLPHVSRSPAPL